MNFLQRAAAILVMTAAAGVVAAPAFAQTCACAPGGGYVIQADEAPPPLPEYDQPPIPAPGYYWTPGYWAWNNYDYYWVPGAWVEPPQPGLLWTPGYWAFVGGIYAFRPGYWAPQVGFYGGVDYGFGYAGSGYQGGRWDHGRFFYNTAVNNIGAAHIANVYHQPIVRNATVNRASFNGGPGGVVVKPTNAELLAEKEPHVRATALQANQARAASMRSEQFVSTNRGKPAIAATQRPGQFKGKGVIPARAAGKTAEAAPEKPAAVERPVRPEAAPNAPKAEEQRPAVEKLAKPEAAPNAARREEKPTAGRPPAGAERPPAATGRPPEKPPAAAAERTPERPPIAGRPPAAERPVRPEPPHPAAQRAMERPAAAERRPAQPERRPPPNECGRPGLPPCPK